MSFVLDERKKTTHGGILAVEHATIAVAPNGPSSKQQKGGKPFAAQGRRGGTRASPPRLKENAGLRWRDGGTYPSHSLVPQTCQENEQPSKDVLDGLRLLVTKGALGLVRQSMPG